MLYGRAHHDPAAPVATAVPGYLSKYRESITDLGGTDEDFTVDCAVRTTIERVRGFEPHLDVDTCRGHRAPVWHLRIVLRRVSICCARDATRV